MARLSNPQSKQTSYLGRGVKPLPAVQPPGSATSNKPRAVSPRASRSSTPRRSLPQPPTAPPTAKVSDPRQLLQQCLPLHACLPNKLSAPTTASPGLNSNHDAGSTRSLLGGSQHSTPSAELVRRPNGTTAHLLKLPPTVPYVLHMPQDGHHVHIVPCFTPAAAQQIRLDAEAAAKRLGGWAPRAVGCCTNDVLVSQLGAMSQQLIFDAFRRVIMPYACRFFPKANLTPDSLPKNPECFFMIKYSGDRVRPQLSDEPDAAPSASARPPTPPPPARRLLHPTPLERLRLSVQGVCHASQSRKEFGEHTDHTKLTVNISLTNPVTDHTAGGLFLPVPKGILDVEPPTPKGDAAAGAGAKDGAGGTGVATSVMSALGSASRVAAGAVAGALGSASAPMGSCSTLQAKDSRGVMLRPRAGTCMLHHGDVRHAGDRIESGERIQLVAFFYGGERRGNALPLASPHKASFDPAKHAEGPAATSEEIIASVWPKGAMRDPHGKPLTASSSSSSMATVATSSSASSASSGTSVASAQSKRHTSPSPAARALAETTAALVPPTGPRPIGLIERAMLDAQRNITLNEVAALAQA